MERLIELYVVKSNYPSQSGATTFGFENVPTRVDTVPGYRDWEANGGRCYDIDCDLIRELMDGYDAEDINPEIKPLKITVSVDVEQDVPFRHRDK